VRRQLYSEVTYPCSSHLSPNETNSVLGQNSLEFGNDASIIEVSAARTQRDQDFTEACRRAR
jgi:hypothetical protein